MLADKECLRKCADVDIYKNAEQERDDKPVADDCEMEKMAAELAAAREEIERLNENIRIKREQIYNLAQQLSEKRARVRELSEIADKRAEFITYTVNSFSWKITKPLRKMRDKFKSDEDK